MNKFIYVFINQISPRLSNANIKILPGAYEAYRLEGGDVTIPLKDNEDVLLLKTEEGEYWNELMAPEVQ